MKRVMVDGGLIKILEVSTECPQPKAIYSLHVVCKYSKDRLCNIVCASCEVNKDGIYCDGKLIGAY